MPSEKSAVGAWKRQLTPITLDGVRTYLLDQGLGEPTVLLHGIPTQAFVWRDVARVVSRERRVVAPDLLGFGFADRPLSRDLSPSGQAAFIAQLLDELGIRQFALVVHDYGALVGAEMLARDPDRVTHLIVSNTSLRDEGWGGGRLTPFSLLKLPGVGELGFRLARPFMLKQAFRIYVEEDARLTDEIMDVYWRPFEEGFGNVLLAIARGRHKQMTSGDFHRWRQALHDFNRPALVVWGDRDPTFRTRLGQEIANLLPDARLEVFEHSNHFIQEDRPEAFGRLIAAFLAGRQSS